MEKMKASLNRRLDKVTQTNLDEAGLITSLEYLSTWYDDNTADARRNLRSEMEKRSLAVNNDFLNAFKIVQQHLDEVQATVDGMKSCCVNMEQRLNHTKQNAGQLLAKAEQLQQKRNENVARKNMADAFLSRFELTAEENAALHESSAISKDFFLALRRVMQIYSECPILLRTHQQIGFEVMELMSMHQQSAYDKLFRWVKDEFHSIQDDVSDIDPLVVVAVVTLKEKQPVLLNYCFDEIVATRSQMLVEAFHIALTVGGPGGMPRPIEMHAHDPLRYVGDMLAWIHQAVASEYELLNRVFGHEAKNRILSDPELRVLLDWRSRNKNDKENGEKHKSFEVVNDAAQIAVGDNIKEVLSRIFEALVHPFKVRLDHILDEENQPGIVQVYRLSNVLDFYSRTIAKIIGKTSSLTDAFNYCRDETLKLFYNLIKQHSEKLMASITRPPPDLAPPHAVHEAMSRLMEIMATFDESLVPSDEREREFAPVVASVIDPLVHMCTVNATVLNAPDMAVYLINCLSVMKNTVAAYEFTSERAEALGLHIDSHMDTLVQEETAIFLRHCNLVEKLHILQNRTSERPLSKEPSMDSRAVGTAMRSFERALFELEALIMPQCDRLVDTILRRTAKDRVGQVIVNVYETLYEAIVDPRNKYDDHPTILHYKPDQVRTMLGL